MLFFFLFFKVCLHLNTCLAKSSEWILKKLMFFLFDLKSGHSCPVRVPQCYCWCQWQQDLIINHFAARRWTTASLLLSIFLFFLCNFNINIWLFCVIFTCSSPRFSLFPFGARPTFVTNWLGRSFKSDVTWLVVTHVNAMFNSQWGSM